MAVKTLFTLTRRNAYDFIPGRSPVNKRRDALTRVSNLLAAAAAGAKTATALTIADNAVAASATLTFATMVAGTVVNVNGVPFTCMASGAVGNQFNVGVTDTAAAANLAAAINASTSAAITGVLTATAASGVVTVTATTPGANGNAVTIEDRGIRASGTLTISSGSGLVGGTINGVLITATWATSDTVAAAAVAAAINAKADALITGLVSAFSVAGVVTVQSLQDGLVGNTVTLVASGTGVTASGARLTGGAVVGTQASGTLTITGGSGAEAAVINGVTISVTWATSDTNTAALLAAAIQASSNALILGVVVATSAATVVTVKATLAGVAGNQITLAATGTGNVASGARLTAGAAPTVTGPSSPRLTSGANDSILAYTV